MPPLNPAAALQQFTGFSPDGLSYAVADDAGKLFAQAMAAYEARAANPRNDIYGRTLREDTPEALRMELLDPVAMRFGLGGLGRASSGKTDTYHVGNTLVQRNPLTGGFDPVFTSTPKPVAEKEIEVPTSFDYQGKAAATVKATPTQWREWQSARGLVPPNMATNFPLNAILAPKTAAAPAAQGIPPMLRRPPEGFIGTPGGTNLFNNAVKAGMEAVASPSEGFKKVGRFVIKPPKAK